MRADSPLQSLDGLALEDRWRPSRSPSGSDLHVARCTNCRRSMPEALPSLVQDPDTGDKYCGPECRWTARLARGRAGSNTALDVVAANAAAAAAEKAPVDPPGAPAPKAEKQQPAPDTGSGASQRARRPRVDSNRWRRKALVQAADEARSDREAQGVYNAIFMFDSVEGHCPAGCTATASPRSPREMFRPPRLASPHSALVVPAASPRALSSGVCSPLSRGACGVPERQNAAAVGASPRESAAAPTTTATGPTRATAGSPPRRHEMRVLRSGAKVYRKAS